MKKKDSYSYKGWITSDRLFKRAVAVWLHYALIHVIFTIGLLLILLPFWI